MVLIVDYFLEEYLEDGMPSGGGSTRQSASWAALLKESCTEFTVVPSSLRKSGFLMRLKWFRDFALTYPGSHFYFSVLGKHTLICFILRHILGIRFKYIQRISNNHVMQSRHKQTAMINYFINKLLLSTPDVILVQNHSQLNIISNFYKGKLILAENPYTTFKVKVELPVFDFIWIGIIQPQKNIDLLWEIASLYPELNFHVIGPNKYGLKLKVLPNIIYYGELTNVETLKMLAKAKCLLNTSHYEGLANIFLEASSRGIPILKPESIFCPIHCRSYDYDILNVKNIFSNKISNQIAYRKCIQEEFYNRQLRINEEVIKHLQ